MSDLAATFSTLLQSRQTILPKRLLAPGPDPQQLEMILDAAAHAPDHDQVLPWRFVLIPQARRADLGEAFAQALVARDASALPEQIEQAREKALRAPVLLLLVVDAARGPAEIDLNERLLSAGCAVQSMLLMATALGFGSALTSGKAMKSVALRRLFGLAPGDHAVCFLSLGSVTHSRAAPQRPTRADYLSSL